MAKDRIIREIQRTAKANGGTPLGWRRFESETGIRHSDWYPHIWLRWNDGLREAGFEPNRMTAAYTRDFLIEKLLALTRQLGRVPIQGDILRAAKLDAEFPSEKAFRRLGRKSLRVAGVLAYCESKSNHDDVALLWRQIEVARLSADSDDTCFAETVGGYVYMLKHGSRREYKIGKTNHPIRREGELGIQLPETLRPIHYIKTDDPAGVERYWHTRFADKRKQGEWFALTADDVRAFKRWKRIY